MNTVWNIDNFPNAAVESYTMKFKNPFNGRKVPVTIWRCDKGAFSYTVRAGANSDYSYTGLCVDCLNEEAAKAYIIDLSYKNLLFK